MSGLWLRVLLGICIITSIIASSETDNSGCSFRCRIPGGCPPLCGSPMYACFQDPLLPTAASKVHSSLGATFRSGNNPNFTNGSSASRPNTNTTVDKNVNLGKQSYCDHKRLFPLRANDLLAFTILFFALALASGSGVGGGAIIIPVLIVICQFSPYYAIPLSNTAIFGGAIVRFCMQITDHHPNPAVRHRTLIDFPCISLLLPAALAGTTLGVMANQASPEWMVRLTTIIVLSYAVYVTFQKAFELWRSEQQVPVDRLSVDGIVVEMNSVNELLRSSPSNTEILSSPSGFTGGQSGFEANPGAREIGRIPRPKSSAPVFPQRPVNRLIGAVQSFNCTYITNGNACGNSDIGSTTHVVPSVVISRNPNEPLSKSEEAFDEERDIFTEWSAFVDDTPPPLPSSQRSQSTLALLQFRQLYCWWRVRRRFCQLYKISCFILTKSWNWCKLCFIRLFGGSVKLLILFSQRVGDVFWILRKIPLSLIHQTNVAEALTLEEIMVQESRFPIGYLVNDFLLLTILTLLSLFKGGITRGENRPAIQLKPFLGGIQPCSPAYFFILIVTLSLLILSVVTSGSRLIREHAVKERLGYLFVEGDLRYNSWSKVLWYASLSAGVGLLAGFLGIGGAMLLGPLLLQLGMTPRVSAATSSFVTLFTSSAAAFQFLFLHRVPMGYGSHLFLLSFSASYVGLRVVLYFVHRYHKASLIVFALAMTLLFGLIMLAGLGYVDLRERQLQLLHVVSADVGAVSVANNGSGSGSLSRLSVPVPKLVFSFCPKQ